MRYLMAAGADDSRLSPDGGTLAFEWSVTGKPQLWLVSSDGGWPEQRTLHIAVMGGSYGGYMVNYAENSPIYNAHWINVPLLVSHGTNDPRETATESDRLVEAARSAGNEITYMRFPDEGHSIGKLGNRVVCYRRVAAFLGEHLLPVQNDSG